MFSSTPTTLLPLHTPTKTRPRPCPRLRLTLPRCSVSNHLKTWSERLAVLAFGSAVLVGTLRFREGFRGKLEAKVGAAPVDMEGLKMEFYGEMKRGRTPEAVEVVERMVEMDPDEVEWRLLRALCYEQMGRLATAKRLFRDILEEKPLLIKALHGLALVMHKNHEGPAVFEMLDKALELARQEERVTEERNIQILIAQMHVVQGNLEEGLKRFQALVNLDPRDFRPFLCQGIIYSLLDKKEEANEQFEIYRSLVPEEYPQRSFLDDVVLTARTAASQEKLKEEFESKFSTKKQ